MSQMQNLIPSPVPSKIEAQPASPAKQTGGKSDAAKENGFADQLDQATENVDRKDNQSFSENGNQRVEPSSQENKNTEASFLTNQPTQNKSPELSTSTTPINTTLEIRSEQNLQQAVTQQPALPDTGKAELNTKQDNLLSQIQKIINDNDTSPEKVVIRSEQQAGQNSPALFNKLAQAIPANNSQTSQTTQTTQESVLTSVINNITDTAIPTQNKPLRNEIGSQRMERGQNAFASRMSKSGNAKIFNNEINIQQNQAETNQQGQQQSNSTQLLSTAKNANPSSPFNPITQVAATQMVETALNINTVVNQNSVVLPGSTIVYDHQILQQIQQQARININKMQHKLKMQLHPVELGELKLDLTIKEGAIRVNVVAQTKQAQEVLERNMPKLKHIFEEQGLTVDDITVAQASDASGNFNFFGGQFESSTGFAKQNSSENSFRHSVKREQAEELTPDEPAFVEITGNSTDVPGISVTI